MAEDIKKRMKKFEEKVKEDRHKNIYLSSIVHTDHITGDETGYMKVFFSYQKAKDDADGNEPIKIGTQT